MKDKHHYKVTVELVDPLSEANRHGNSTTLYEQRVMELDLNAVINAVNLPLTVEQLKKQVGA